MKWILVLLSVIGMKTCDNTNVQKQSAILNNTYNITTLGGKDVSEFKLTITFKDSTKQVSGFSGCNRFFGSYEIKNNRLLLGPLASTKMMCSPEFNNIESNMLQALSKVNSFLLKDNTLKLFEEDTTLLKAEKQDISTSIAFEYSQQSRNSFQHIKMNRKSISVQNERDGTIIEIAADKHWGKIIQIVKNIKIQNLPNLKAPSQKRFFDGAAIAKFKVILDGKAYETPVFDHGNPHPDIANLVKEILSIAQNVE